MSALIFLEIIFDAKDIAALPNFSRDEIEDALLDLLEDEGWGDVVGGGSGKGSVLIEVELEERYFDEALKGIKLLLQSLHVPQSTFVKQSTPAPAKIFQIYS